MISGLSAAALVKSADARSKSAGRRSALEAGRPVYFALVAGQIRRVAALFSLLSAKNREFLAFSAPKQKNRSKKIKHSRALLAFSLFWVTPKPSVRRRGRG